MIFYLSLKKEYSPLRTGIPIKIKELYPIGLFTAPDFE
jgi:hypothetical protein